MSARKYRGTYWELAGIIGRLAFALLSIGLFTYACLTDDYGMAIFWGVLLLLNEIRDTAEKVTS